MSSQSSQHSKVSILNTRPIGQNEALTSIIESAGGESIAFPVIAIEPTEGWEKQAFSFERIKYAIFISANAATYFFKAIRTRQSSWPSSINIIAIGPATADALTQEGVRVDFIPEDANSEGVLKLNVLKSVKQENILLIKGEGGLSLLEDELTKRGATVESIDVYRRALPSYSQSFIRALWQDDSVDIILLTSQEAAQNLFTLMGTEAEHWLISKRYIVISQRIADFANKLGIKSVILCNYSDLYNKITILCEKKKKT
jgi:uroporphyrinogen-III synthase